MTAISGIFLEIECDSFINRVKRRSINGFLLLSNIITLTPFTPWVREPPAFFFFFNYQIHFPSIYSYTWNVTVGKNIHHLSHLLWDKLSQNHLSLDTVSLRGPLESMFENF